MAAPAQPGEKNRSPHWPKCRAAHLQKQPACAACGSRVHLEVHHRVPFHLRPDLELAEENLITLCESPTHNCHLLFGHGLDWSAFNPAVVSDAARAEKIVAGRQYTL